MTTHDNDERDDGIEDDTMLVAQPGGLVFVHEVGGEVTRIAPKHVARMTKLPN